MFSLSALGCCGLSLPCQGLENIAENMKAVSITPNIRTCGDGFLFYSHAIFSARKGLITKNYLLSLILDSCALIRLLRGRRKAKPHKGGFPMGKFLSTLGTKSFGLGNFLSTLGTFSFGFVNKSCGFGLQNALSFSYENEYH